jgi:polyphosphate kinase 2
MSNEKHRRGKDKSGEKQGEKVKQPGKPEKIGDKEYRRQLKRLHVELVKLQRWVVHKGLKVCIVFEGRDGAGKGGTIKAITERVSSRVFRVYALPAPTEREKTQMYLQRYISLLPAAGEIVIFDRSWYNRAGIERVMGFCSEEEADHFLEGVSRSERAMVDSGIILLKYWLEVSPEEQQRRMEGRVNDGRKIWKLSPMDIRSYDKWDEYTRARDLMFQASDTPWAAWFVANSDVKKHVRLNVISHLLKQIPYEELPQAKVKFGKREIGKYQEVDYPFKRIADIASE